MKRCISTVGQIYTLLSLCMGVMWFTAGKALAQYPDMVWVKPVQGIADKFRNGIDVDNQGNVYTVGIFKGTADFDPGPGVFNMTSTTNYNDIYIQKLDANGDFVWAKRFNCSAQDAELQAIAVDDSGNVYMAGCLRGVNVADLDPGPGTFYGSANSGGYAPFMVKLNTAGNFVWAWTVGATGVQPRDITIDYAGNIYLVGDFTGSMPGFGTAIGWDGFVIKFTPGGQQLWTHKITHPSSGGGFSDRINGVTTDNQGNVYFTGYFYGSIDFDPGPGTYNMGSVGEGRIFVLKLDENKNFIWARDAVKQQGYIGQMEGFSVAVDAQGNVFTTGAFTHNVDFDPGPGTHYVQTADNGANPDAYIWKLDVNGNFVWVKRIGNLLDDWGTDIATDAQGNVYTLGYFFYSSVDMDPGPGVYNVYGSAYEDIFMQKMDGNGNFIWAFELASSGADKARSFVVQPNNDIYLAARTYSGDVDPDTNASYFLPLGSGSYAMKLAQCVGTTITQSITACSSYTVNGQTYTSGGAYTQTIPGVNGCDTSLILNLIINQPTASTLTQMSCDSYTLNGQTYTGSGTYTQQLTNAQGCDSTLTLHLTITNSTSSSITQTACNSYTLNGQTYTVSGTYTQQLTNAQGCDSTLTLHLTITNSTSSSITQTACDSYTLNGQTYTVSGTYTQLLTNSQGCDSTLTLHLMLTNSTSSSITQTACDSYTLNGQTYTVSGTYTQQLTNHLGCDSTLTLHLMLTNSTSSSITQTACDSYTLNGQTYTGSGTYTQQLTNAQGCDSTLTLHLTITHSSSSTLTEISCDSYTLNGQAYTSSGTYTQQLTNSQGCDSTLTLHLTLTNSTSSTLTQTSCDSYMLNGQTYTVSGTYTQLMTNHLGCDSTITLQLTIGTIDHSVTQNDHVLTANETNADYQWVFCSNHQSIAGETGQTYTATANGDYAVIVNNGICVDTSACYTVVTLHIESPEMQSLQVFPNPTDGIISVQFDGAIYNAIIRITDMTGRIILEKNPISGAYFTFDITSQPTGVYLLEVISEGHPRIHKIIRK